MRIPVDSSISGLIETLKAFGYERLINRMAWTWTEDGWHLKFSGARNKSGYGHIGVDRATASYLGQQVGPKTSPTAILHRLVYALEVGNLPKGAIDSDLTVDHADGDLTNDNPSNLQIMTRIGNQEKGRNYGFGFCNQAGHPIVGRNREPKQGHYFGCKYCHYSRNRINKARYRNSKVSPMPEFWTWMLSQYGDAADPELAMYKDTGLLVPVVI